MTNSSTQHIVSVQSSLQITLAGPERIVCFGGSFDCSSHGHETMVIVASVA